MANKKLQIEVEVNSSQVDQAVEKTGKLVDLGKGLKIQYDIDGKPLDVVIDKSLNLQKQVRLLTAELRKTKEGTAEFKILSTALGDTQDKLAQTNAKSRDLLGSLQLIPGPVGEIASKLNGAISVLKTFSSFSLKDLRFQFGETINDVKDIVKNFLGLSDITVDAKTKQDEYNNTLEVSKNMTNGYVDASIVQNGIIQKSKDRYVEATDAVCELEIQIGNLNDSLKQTVTAAATNPFNTITNGAKQLKDVTGKIVADLSKISYAGLPQMNGANVPQVVNPILPTQAPQTLPEGGIQPAQGILDAQALMDLTRQFEVLDQAMQLTNELANIAGGAFNAFSVVLVNSICLLAISSTYRDVIA